MKHDLSRFRQNAVKAHSNPFVLDRLTAPNPFVTKGERGVASALSFFDISLNPAELQARELASASLVNQQRVIQTIRKWQDLGHSLEDIYLSGVTSATRLLGDWWYLDEICFSDVSISAFRLQQALTDLSPEFLKDAMQGLCPRRILLINPPGSQHTLGSCMAAEFFRRGGWQVIGMDARDESAVLRLLHTEWFDSAGFSVASDRQVEVLTNLIQKVRSVSVNIDIRVVVGGPMVSLNPQIFEDLGADCGFSDVRSALISINQTTQSVKPCH